MKKRFFLLIILIGFVSIFSVTKKYPITQSQDFDSLIPVDTSVVQAAPLEEAGPLEDMQIVLDAGHGGYDGGAVGQNGTIEKDVTLSMTLLLKNQLEEAGAAVELTREDDVFLSLESRVDIAEDHRADLLISIHADGFEDSEAKGMTTYYYDDESEDIATSIQNYIFKESIKTDNRGVSFGNYQVLRDSFMPAVLVELGYITNIEDEMSLNRYEFQKKVSKQIAKGIIHHTEEDKLEDEVTTHLTLEASLNGFEFRTSHFFD